MNKNHFEYLIEKINNTNFTSSPFKFLYIEDFLHRDDFDNMLACNQFADTNCSTPIELLETLKDRGWQSVRHPGTFINEKDYLLWRQNHQIDSKSIISGDVALTNLCEGSGFALRLKKQPPLISELLDLFRSSQFIDCVHQKFSLDGSLDTYMIDTGIQKYLNGYEISPHPDIREKALTWMLNLNSNSSELENYHTHFSEFKPNKSYIYELWDHYPDIQRQWIPWDWTDTTFMQNKNNSITIFSPSNKSLHAVRAIYNDLNNQRTQLYGNIWYEDISCKSFTSNYQQSTWNDLVYRPSNSSQFSIKTITSRFFERLGLLRN